jgi:murein DD-endopeptidase MepM/ murein hydrolase activator NlpD
MQKRLVGVVFALLVTIVAAGYLFKSNTKSKKKLPKEIVVIDTISAEPVEVLRKYGLVLDSLDIEENKIMRNQTLAHILGQYNISPLLVNQISAQSKGIYNLANIHSGKSYKVYKSKDSLSTLQCFVYEASPMDHIVVKLTNGIEVFKDEIPVDTTIRSIGGIVENNLYETINSLNATQDLAANLAQMFAWQVDFFRLFKGDNFKVIYEEISVNDQAIKTGKILAASFEQHGKTYYAINFEEDGKAKYFNEEGLNVRGAFLKAPLKFFRITSRFSKKRFHPVQKRVKAHLGTDYAAPTGTPIIAVGAGTVVEARYSQFNGNYVKIKHNGTYTTQYLHMNKIAKGMRKGVRVAQGQVIGYVGSTGLATGPHVCYRFWKNGKQIDPRNDNVIQTDPIKKQNKEAFEIVKTDMIAKLDSIPLMQETELMVSNE